MATVGTAPTPISAPPATAPRVGLLASFPTETGIAGWERGIWYLPEGVEGSTIGGCNPGTRTDPDQPSIVEWMPYILTTALICSTFSNFTENSARVFRALNADTERQLGHELWTGSIAQSAVDGAGDPFPNEYLAHQTVDNLTPTGPVGLVHGLACLEQYLFDNANGEQGAIHATAQVVTHWESFRLLRREGNRILTMKDTVVIPSAGYPGTNPDGGIHDNDVWAYATDIPRIFLGDIQAPQELIQTTDYKNNTVVYQAQRMALVEWQLARHAGVQLAITLCGEGGS